MLYRRNVVEKDRAGMLAAQCGRSSIMVGASVPEKRTAAELDTLDRRERRRKPRGGGSIAAPTVQYGPVAAFLQGSAADDAQRGAREASVADYLVANSASTTSSRWRQGDDVDKRLRRAVATVGSLGNWLDARGQFPKAGKIGRQDEHERRQN